MKGKFIAIMLVTMTALTACGSSESEATEGEKGYTSEFNSETNQTIIADGISYEIPKSWQNTGNNIQVGNDGVMSLTAGEYNDAPDMSLQENQDQAAESVMNTYDNSSEISRETLTIADDVSAFYYIISADVDDLPVTVYSLSFSIDNTFYSLFYLESDSSSESHSKDLESVIYSIKREA